MAKFRFIACAAAALAAATWGLSAAAEPPAPPVSEAELRAAAEAGDAKAQFELGGRLAKLFSQDPAKPRTPADMAAGLPWLEKAAGQGHAEAANALGVIAQHGLAGGPPDPAGGRAWLEKAAGFGSAIAKVNLAGLLMADGAGASDARARALLKECLEHEVAGPLAREPLAQLMLLGRGGPSDIAGAIALYREVLVRDPGNAAANWALGRAYENGWAGLGKDAGASVGHFRAAALAGLPDAAWKVGMAHVNGRGAPRDEAEAYRWVSRAAEGGFVDGMISRAVMLATGQGTALDAAGARLWYERAASAGSAHALRGLGAMIFNGEGAPADPVTGLALLEVARDGGDAIAAKLAAEIVKNANLASRRAEIEAAKSAWLASHGMTQEDFRGG